MNAVALPTRRDEAWRYADLDALARAWPLPARREIVVADGDAIARTIVIDGGDAAVEEWRVVLGDGARAEFEVVVAGAAYGRVAIEVEVGAGAHFSLKGVTLGRDQQTVEIVTDIRHVAVGGTSSQVVRSVLAGRATGSYLGRVAVSRGAQQVDGSQSVKAMLLDRTATANLKPELEIFADDVKCAHGATVGELDARALFYLASRGLPPAQAKVMLLRAFVADVFGNDEDGAAAVAANAALERLL